MNILGTNFAPCPVEFHHTNAVNGAIIIFGLLAVCLTHCTGPEIDDTSTEKGTAESRITFVEATMANTSVAADGPDSLWADGDDGTTGGTVADGAARADQKWRFRSSYGINGIWEATGSSATAENAVEIVSSISGVPRGVYDVYVFFYAVEAAGDYPIRAGLTSSPSSNPIFDNLGNLGTQGGLDAHADLDFHVAPPPSNRALRYGLVGQVTVSDGTLSIFIDDYPGSQVGNSRARTWYEGFGYRVAQSSPATPDWVAGDLIAIDAESGWTWYTDERAIVDFPRIIVGGIRGNDLFGTIGDVMCTTFDLRSGQRTPFVLGGPPIAEPSNKPPGESLEDQDDHNTASFAKLPDGHYYAAWTSHSENNFTYLRKSTHPNDATAWDPTERYVRRPSDGASGTNDVSYANLIYLSAEGTGQGRLYNFHRNEGEGSWDRYFIFSDDLGVTWQWGGRHTGEDTNRVRPYPKYASNGVDTIYFITTEDNSGHNIWSGYLKDGKGHRMDGTVVDFNIFDNVAPAVDAYTPVMMSGTVVDGVPMRLLWTRDLELDRSGTLAATWRAYGNGSSSDARHFYGRWMPSTQAWLVNQLAFTGNLPILKQQDGFEQHRGTPLSAINPANVNVTYFASSVDPETNSEIFSSAVGRPMLEVYRAETSDNGASWTYEAITRNSSSHNFRVTVLDWDEENTAVMWMRGYYDKWLFDSTHSGWDTTLVVYLDRPGETVSDLMYVDADPYTNTSLASGTPVSVTTADAAGSDDGRWHLRTGLDYSNRGTVLTANERLPYNEDTSVIRTTARDMDAGTYDVYVLFWSRVTEDWDVMAGLSPSSLMLFERQGSQHAVASEFSSRVQVSNGRNIYLYRGYVGRVSLESPQSIDVYVDQLPGGRTANRTWYDGIALRRVTLN
jgi:hypothetical protein